MAALVIFKTILNFGFKWIQYLYILQIYLYLYKKNMKNFIKTSLLFTFGICSTYLHAQTTPQNNSNSTSTPQLDAASQRQKADLLKAAREEQLRRGAKPTEEELAAKKAENDSFVAQQQRLMKRNEENRAKAKAANEAAAKKRSEEQAIIANRQADMVKMNKMRAADEARRDSINKANAGKPVKK